MSQPVAITAAWAESVLDYWFEDLGERDWFARSDSIDRAILSRFGELHRRLATGDDLDDTDPRQVLAAVIVLDQFSRNMYRGTPQAFASDPTARRLARSLVDRGLDQSLARNERLFLYLPFEHSEDRDDQALSVHLIRQLGDESWTNYALAHQAIIDRCRRFPHRNAILGRSSTADELVILDGPMGSF